MFQVNSTTNNQAAPAVAMDSTGDFVVAWQSQGQDGSNYGVYAKRYALNLSLAAGSTASVAIKVMDQFGKDFTGDSITLSDALGGASFSANPVASFTGGVATVTATLDAAGVQTITVTDSTAAISATSSPVIVTPAAASQLLVSASPTSLSAGGATSVTITAEDQYNNVVTSFSDSVMLSDSLGGASFSAVSFTNGVATITATLDAAGSQTITASDSSATISGTSSAISVSPAAAPGFVVTSDAGSGPGSLAAEISLALAAGGSNTITFASSLTGPTGNTISLSSGNANAAATQFGFGPTAFYINNSGNSTNSLTINGASSGVVISGSNSVRLFAIAGGNALTLENLTLENGLAQGGAGGSGTNDGGGGGGGAGLGGAVFDDGGSFTALGCTFTNNTAQGGAGGRRAVRDPGAAVEEVAWARTPREPAAADCMGRLVAASAASAAAVAAALAPAAVAASAVAAPAAATAIMAARAASAAAEEEEEPNTVAAMAAAMAAAPAVSAARAAPAA